MSVRVPLALSVALVIGFSTLTSSSRYRYASPPSSPYRGYDPQHSNRVPAGVGSYGGYSADPRTRELEILADKYRPRGW